jgi:hypothetical protein
MTSTMPRILIPILWLALTLGGCTAPLSHQQLSAFSRGMSPQEVVEKTKIAPLAKTTVTADGRSFEFQRYALNNGMGVDVYFLAFEKGGLVYWGYPSEFRRHPDATYGRALDMAIGNFQSNAGKP